MTMDIRNLTPEQKQMILAAGKDGFSAEELRKLGLNKQIAEALFNSLAGEAEEVGDKAKFSSDKDTALTDREQLDKEAKAKKQQYKEDAVTAFKEGKYGEWLKNSWNHATAPNGAYSQARSPLMGALPFVLALVATAATSCGDFLEPDMPELIPVPDDKDEKPTITVIQNNNTTVNATIIKNGMSLEDFTAILAPYLQQILDAINNGNETTDYTELLNSILAELQRQNEELKSLSDIKVLLQALGLDSDEIKKLLEQVNQNLENLKEECKAKLDELNNNVSEVITYLESQGKALADIVVALQANGVKLDTIIEAMTKNGETLSGIYDIMVENNIDNKEILKAINALIGQNSEVGEKLDSIIKLLETGITLDAETQSLVGKVLDAVYNLKVGDGSGGNFDTANIEKTLAAILDVVKNLPTKDDVKEMNDCTKECLDKLVTVVVNFMGQETAMDSKTHAMLDQILTAIKNMGTISGGEGGNVTVDLTAVENALGAILKAIENVNGSLNNMENSLKDAISNLTNQLNAFMEQEAEMDANEKELAQKILNAITNLTLGGSGGDVTVEVDLSKLEAMMSILIEKAGNLEGGIEKLIELALAGNENIGDLIKVVQAFKDDTKADLNDIKELLKTVKDGVDKNGNTLLNIEEKLDLVNLTLKELKDQFPDLSAKLDEVIAKLGEILEKIPEGCDCNIDEILIKLDVIITKLQESPSNEGIVDDLEDLLQ